MTGKRLKAMRERLDRARAARHGLLAELERNLAAVRAELDRLDEAERRLEGADEETAKRLLSRKKE